MKKTKEQRERLDAYQQVVREHGFTKLEDDSSTGIVVMKKDDKTFFKFLYEDNSWRFVDIENEREVSAWGIQELRNWLKQMKIAKRLNNKKAEIPFVVGSKLAKFVDDSTVSSHWGGERVLFVAMTFGLAKQISRAIATKGDEKSTMFKLAAALEEETTN